MTDLLVLTEVSKSFGGLDAIAEVSLTVTTGSIVAVVGGNGAGKTTLFDLITGAYRPDAGKMRFRGRTLIGLRPDETCLAGISRTFQPPQMFGGLSVLDTVVIATLLHARDAVEARGQALEMLDLMGLVRLAHQPSTSLTLPQRKSLELARALATRPYLLLLDELLTELEPAEIEPMVRVLRAFNRRPGLTILLAEARLNTVAALADRVVMLDQGRVIAEADPARLVGFGDDGPLR